MHRGNKKTLLVSAHMAVVINDNLLHEAKDFFENTMTTEMETSENNAHSSEDML